MKAGTPPPHQIGSTSPPSPSKELMMTFFKTFIRGSNVCVEGGLIALLGLFYG